MNDPKRLAEIVRQLHGVDATHVRSVDVHERFQGQTAWQGTVEVFSIRGHPEPSLAYAWTFEDDDGNTRHKAVLGVPPINSAVDAVRAAVVAEANQRPVRRFDG